MGSLGADSCESGRSGRCVYVLTCMLTSAPCWSYFRLTCDPATGTMCAPCNTCNRTTSQGPYMVNNLVPNGSAAVSEALVVGDLVYGGIPRPLLVGDAPSVSKHIACIHAGKGRQERARTRMSRAPAYRWHLLARGHALLWGRQ